MTRLLSIAPQLLVADLERSLTYYCQALAFRQTISYGDFYAAVARDCAILHLKLATAEELSRLTDERALRRQHGHIDAYITVENLDDFFSQCRAGGASIYQEIQTQPWDVRDFCVEDPDGHILCFAAA